MHVQHLIIVYTENTRVIKDKILRERKDINYGEKNLTRQKGKFLTKKSFITTRTSSSSSITAFIVPVH